MQNKFSVSHNQYIGSSGTGWLSFWASANKCCYQDLLPATQLYHSGSRVNFIRIFLYTLLKRLPKRVFYLNLFQRYGFGCIFLAKRYLSHKIVCPQVLINLLVLLTPFSYWESNFQKNFWGFVCPIYSETAITKLEDKVLSVNPSTYSEWHHSLFSLKGLPMRKMVQNFSHKIRPCGISNERIQLVLSQTLYFWCWVKHMWGLKRWIPETSLARTYRTGKSNKIPMMHLH